LYNQKIDGVKN